MTYQPVPDFLGFVERERRQESARQRSTGQTYELDPEFQEYLRREESAEPAVQLSFPWDD